MQESQQKQKGEISKDGHKNKGNYRIRQSKAYKQSKQNSKHKQAQTQALHNRQLSSVYPLVQPSTED